MRISRRFRRMVPVYRYFARSWSASMDFSDDALLSLYEHESHGKPLSSNNGYAVGKRYLNLQVTMWREDLVQGLLGKRELYDDPDLPHWFLDSVLKDLAIRRPAWMKETQ